MSPLREKMIKAMQLNNLAKNTQRCYLSAVTGIARHYQQSPDTLSQQMIEDYLLYLRNTKGNAPESCAFVATGLRFFYKHVADKEILFVFRIRKKAKNLPNVLTQEEVWDLINAPTNLKHRLILMTAYSAGLRACEVAALKPQHIDSKRMLIKIAKTKNNEQRYSILSVKLLEELRHYYETCKPQTYLFPSSYIHKENQPLSYTAVRMIYEKARKKAGITNGAGTHTLRHHADSRIMPTPLDYFSHLAVIPIFFFSIPLVNSA